MTNDARTVVHSPVTTGINDQQHRLLMACVTDYAFVFLDADARVNGWNAGAEQLFGYGEVEILGQPFAKFFTTDDRARNVPQLELREAEIHGRAGDERLHVRKDGTEFWASGVTTVLRDDSGTLRGFVKVLRDHTDRWREAEAQLRLAAIVDSSGDAIIGNNLDGIITTWNPAAEQLYGWAAVDALGKPTSMLVPADRPTDLEGIRHSLEHGERVETFETVRVRKDGQRIDVELTVSPVKDATGCVIGASAISHDITERLRLEAQARQTQKMEIVGQLASGVAHDFNNLIQVITGCGDLLLEDLPPASPARELVEDMTKAGERAAALTRQLLAFSRQQVLTLKVLDVNAVVREVEKLLKWVIGADVALASTLQPDLPPVKADAGQLEQVLMNLAVNARDAMPQGGRLTIETKSVELDEAYAQTRAEVRPGRYVLLAVSDTGHGMTAEVKAHIFEPFFTTKEKGKGTGLGLATVFGIVKQSGGHVAVYSAVGHGTTFKVYLPQVEEAVTPPKPSPAAAAISRGQETLLLVEDDDAVRALTRHILKHSGYRLLEAANGHEALRLAEQHPEPIHLLVSDVVMPGLGGRQLADKLLLLHPETKVLYLSGYTDDAVVRHRILDAEVNFLQKPFRTAELTS